MNMSSLEILFFVFALLCVYSYFIYPVLLMLVPARRDLDVRFDEASVLPSISLIVAAHNEAAYIKAKLENTIQIDYPPELLEIIVASDFSTDETDNIVKSYADKGVRLVRADQRKGKEYAQLCAIRVSRGDILVFSDVGTQISAKALRAFVVRFDDPQIGALSSEDQFISDDGDTVGEGAYIKYEMWLRRLESCRAGLVGLSGSFFAARREVCEDWDIYMCSDFNTALNSTKKKLVAITCPDVVGIYKDIKYPEQEYSRKVRTVIRGFTAMVRHPEVLNPFSMGALFAFQIWSHKIMRWGVPWFMAVFLLLTFMLQGQGMIYTLALVAQLVFYGLAVAGWLSAGLRKNILIKIIYFFVQTNLALAQAAVLFLLGKRMTVWTPSKR